MVSTTAGGRPLKSATSRSGPTHGGSIDLDVVELGRSPGELNRVAELNCAREPARQAG